VKLEEVVSTLGAFNEDAVICVRRPWTAGAEAAVGGRRSGRPGVRGATIFRSRRPVASRCPSSSVTYRSDAVRLPLAENAHLHIGLGPHGSCLFLYLVTTPFPTTFPTFLTRHPRLFSALRSWRLRLIIPPIVSDATDADMRTAHQALEPLRHCRCRDARTRVPGDALVLAARAVDRHGVTCVAGPFMRETSGGTGAADVSEHPADDVRELPDPGTGCQAASTRTVSPSRLAISMSALLSSSSHWRSPQAIGSMRLSVRAAAHHSSSAS